MIALPVPKGKKTTSKKKTKKKKKTAGQMRSQEKRVARKLTDRSRKKAIMTAGELSKKLKAARERGDWAEVERLLGARRGVY